MTAVVRRDILGCPFDVVRFDETVERIRQAVREGSRLHVVTSNVDFVVKTRRDPAFAEDLRKAELVVADGVPVLWAAKLLGTPLAGRVNGTELVWACARVSAEEGCAVALIGAAPGVADRAARAMEARHPGAKLFAIPTPCPLTPEANAELLASIRASGAKIVLAALGAPRQERWLRSHLRESGAFVGIGIGGSFDIISGDKPRAPQWMCDHGLEWLQRLSLEPGRLGRRYLIEDTPFLFHLAIALMRRPFAREIPR